MKDLRQTNNRHRRRDKQKTQTNKQTNERTNKQRNAAVAEKVGGAANTRNKRGVAESAGGSKLALRFLRGIGGQRTSPSHVHWCSTLAWGGAVGCLLGFRLELLLRFEEPLDDVRHAHGVLGHTHHRLRSCTPLRCVTAHRSRAVAVCRTDRVASGAQPNQKSLPAEGKAVDGH